MERRINTFSGEYLTAYYDFLIEWLGISEEAMELVTDICGWNEGTFDNILYSKTAYHDLEQLAEEDESVLDFLEGYDGVIEYEEEEEEEEEEE